MQHVCFHATELYIVMCLVEISLYRDVRSVSCLLALLCSLLNDLCSVWNQTEILSVSLGLGLRPLGRLREKEFGCCQVFGNASPFTQSDVCLCRSAAVYNSLRKIDGTMLGVGSAEVTTSLTSVTGFSSLSNQIASPVKFQECCQWSVLSSPPLFFFPLPPGMQCSWWCCCSRCWDLAVWG